MASKRSIAIIAAFAMVKCQAEALLKMLAHRILSSRHADVQAVKAAGYDDAQGVEIVLHVALNTLTNCFNEVAKTEIDFPVVNHRAK